VIKKNKKDYKFR